LTQRTALRIARPASLKSLFKPGAAANGLRELHSIDKQHLPQQGLEQGSQCGLATRT